jgi:hypothetical protein
LAAVMQGVKHWKSLYYSRAPRIFMLVYSMENNAFPAMR